MKGYWMKPKLHRAIDGGDLLLGPMQFNWCNRGFRVHLTWPFAVPRTLTVRRGS